MEHRIKEVESIEVNSGGVLDAAGFRATLLEVDGKKILVTQPICGKSFPTTMLEID